MTNSGLNTVTVILWCVFGPGVVSFGTQPTDVMFRS